MPSVGKVKGFFTCWLPLLSYLSLIFFLSHSSEPTGDFELPVSDKVIHFVEYFPLPFLFWRALHTLQKPVIQKHLFLLSLLAAFLYAISDEIHQAFIPLREASMFDLLADTLGILIGGFFLKKGIQSHDENT